MLRILVLDDVRLRREGMSVLLRQLEWVDDVSAAPPDRAASTLAVGRAPNVALLDPSSPGARPALNALLAAAPVIRVVAVGMMDSDEEIVDCLEAGYAGYLCREAGLEELAAVIQAAARDETICCPRVVSALRRRVQELHVRYARPSAAGVRLTPREEDVAALLEEGLSNKEIARRLSITVLTVKNHVHNILEKLHARRRGEAAARLRALRSHGEG